MRWANMKYSGGDYIGSSVYFGVTSSASQPNSVCNFTMEITRIRGILKNITSFHSDDHE